jgi:hypothetical protein
LGILSESNGPLDTVLLHLLHTLVRQRVCIAEGGVGFVRGGRRGELIEESGHELALSLGPATNGRATADGGVLLLDLGRTPLSDPGSEISLEGKRDQVAVMKEPAQERSDFRDLQ